jgi:hypothetical protein
MRRWSNFPPPARWDHFQRIFQPRDRNLFCSCKQIGPTRTVVRDEDFASAFADLQAIERLASVPPLGSDPRREFRLSRSEGQLA